MTESVDWHIPVSVHASRLEKHLEEMRSQLTQCHWWQFKRRWKISGICAAYEYELNYLLEWAGKQQPIFQVLKN